MVEPESRYLIGIDLGTTNTVVAYLDTDVAFNPRRSIQILHIPQIMGNGVVEASPLLSSYCYFVGDEKIPVLPWQIGAHDYMVGMGALQRGVKTPTRLVENAKSWLCHTAVERRARMLPLGGEDDKRISPVEASAKYLRHVKEAWNYLVAKGDPAAEFEQQSVVVTVPASFDEVARTLTVDAAKEAGLGNMTLLEEPQAAFYSWIHDNEEKNLLKEGSVVVVCDVGGGTTDFSVITVEKGAGGLAFQRRAVGRHLLLGGNNMDNAVAHYFEAKVSGVDYRWSKLVHAAREAKESLLSGAPQHTLVVQGEGTKVVGQSSTVTLSQGEIEKLLLEGFFGAYSYEEAQVLKKPQGIRTMGLPFEEEPSITKHLAAFLSQCRQVPDYVLFNGGVMGCRLFRDAVVASLERWFSKKIGVLASHDLYLAVARGACYYGGVRRGLGVAIGGGTARALYLHVDVKETGKAMAMTLLPRGALEGTTFSPDTTFLLTPNKPVSFQLYSSQVRLGDAPGDLVDIAQENMSSLPKLHTVLRYGKATTQPVPVTLQAALTAIGTIELTLLAKETLHRWKLEFQLKAAHGDEDDIMLSRGGRGDETFDVECLKAAEEVVEAAFCDGQDPKRLMVLLEERLGRPRATFPPSLLRGLWEVLVKHAPSKNMSQERQPRWWNAAGFFLRPGFGYPLDDFRMRVLWRVVLSFRGTKSATDLMIQKLICFRRVAGGFNKGQQLEIACDIFKDLYDKKTGWIASRERAHKYLQEERVRTLAAMEHLDIATKIKLGDAILANLEEVHDDAYVWAVGRLGARRLLYGSLQNVVPNDVCIRWVEVLLHATHVKKETLHFALASLASKTDHRDINLPKEVVDRVHDVLGTDAPLAELLENTRAWSLGEQGMLLGDQVPAGLVIGQGDILGTGN